MEGAIERYAPRGARSPKRQRPPASDGDDYFSEQGRENDSGDLAATLEALLGVLATHPRTASIVCNADPRLRDLCATTSVPVTEGLVRQQINLIDLPRLYEPDSDVVRCALWRWVAAFSSLQHDGRIGGRDAPPSLAAMYPVGRYGTMFGDEQGATESRWDVEALPLMEDGRPWPTPLAAMAYDWVPRNDLLLWATTAPATVRTLPEGTVATLAAASTVADAVRGDADVTTDAVLDADSLLCDGGRLFAIMNVPDRVRMWGLPERERVDSLPDDGAVFSADEARQIDERAAETGEPVDTLTVRVFGPPPSIEFDDQVATEATVEAEPRTRWVARLPGPPIDALRLAEVGLWQPLLSAIMAGDVYGGNERPSAGRAPGTAESLYDVLTSDAFVDLAVATINETVERLSAEAVAARGDDIPAQCAQAAVAPVGILPMEVYATYLAGETSPDIVLWVRPVLDRTLIDPDGRDWWTTTP
ncbi:hypothetical protein pkur_cds_127 [Pandoravirus kuranda]|uniref:Uncharacterized protein n=1 Tax=Pandoravirus kuranda TaxID=3019033 RepID=A0AA95ECN4_9VIRU|nr:hypothetical protein pkur_cds_127 [Pandoravirus kuranda]